MEISTLRWAIASFLAGVSVLALASIPLVAFCVGAGGESFDRAALAAGIVAVACTLLVIVTLDLLGARARRTASGRPASREASSAIRSAAPTRKRAPSRASTRARRRSEEGASRGRQPRLPVRRHQYRPRHD